MRVIYNKGYLRGYHTGYDDALAGRERMPFSSNAAVDISIEKMGLSTRAYNCLHRFGCRFASDVASLSQMQILQMRNLGKITAGEIAGVLEDLGIHGTHWETYLY
jgi:DNA-directed RNA polymerase alpha subunit